MPICGSPWLIAAYRVFRRLPVPRHSPCALCSLTMHFSPLQASAHRSVAVTFSAYCSFVPILNTLLSNLFAVILSLFNFQGAELPREKPRSFPRPKTKLPSLRAFRPFIRAGPLSFCFLFLSRERKRKWWAQVDSNHRPRAYQARALTS